jgi:hypothetical protein
LDTHDNKKKDNTDQFLPQKIPSLKIKEEKVEKTNA